MTNPMTTKLTMTPAEALQHIKRARSKGPTHISMHVVVSMPTADGREYPFPAMVSGLTVKQAAKILGDMQRFHDRKVAIGEAGGSVDVNDTLSEYDNRTRFITIG